MAAGITFNASCKTCDLSRRTSVHDFADGEDGQLPHQYCQNARGVLDIRRPERYYELANKAAGRSPTSVTGVQAMRMTKTKIIEKLKELERTESIAILHAVESGSRAWGFASPDSDYDVRFFYVRPRNEYLRLEQRRDVIERQIDGELDINGWDLDKTLRLLHGSNPTLFEWSASPIVYSTTDYFQSIIPVISEYFVAKSGLWHYLSMAEKNYREYLKGEIVRAKKYFYVIRPLLACRWILAKGTPPPMLFSELLDSQLEPEHRPAVDELLRIKRDMPEIGEIPRIGQLNEFIDKNLILVRKQIEQLPDGSKKSWEPLNGIFLRAVEQFIEESNENR
jgi:predicted nucleotidyltransferase